MTEESLQPMVDASPYRPSSGLAWSSGLRQIKTDPALLLHLLNAQLRLRGHGSLPLSVRLDGRVRIKGPGRIDFGRGVSLVGNVVPIEILSHEGGQVSIGDQTGVNYGTLISAHKRVSIGRNCLIGHYCILMDNDHHSIDDHYRLPESRPIVIEDRVWLGSRVTVLPGVCIGHDSVVSAGSIVARDIPANSVAMGFPARVVRSAAPALPAS